MILYGFKAIKLARKTPHNQLLTKYSAIEYDMKLLLYSGNKRQFKACRKLYKLYKNAMLYQYTPAYARYQERLRYR